MEKPLKKKKKKSLPPNAMTLDLNFNGTNH